MSDVTDQPGAVGQGDAQQDGRRDGQDDGLRLIAKTTADEARGYLSALTEVAAGASPDTAIPVLLLAVSQVLVTGARLGAINDVVPSERFEPDAGPEADVEPVRTGLANLFEGLDEYADV